MANLVEGTPLRTTIPAQALETTVDRILYRPVQADWATDEARLVQTLEESNELAAAAVEPEPEGVDSLVVVKVREAFQR